MARSRPAPRPLRADPQNRTTYQHQPGLLAVKAAKYPGQVLDWDRRKLAFTNHAEATRTIVKRDYRKGFEPIRLG
ncbi:MAG: hypothetical protein ACYTGF_16075 [Planctomycetota bacterium]|jgi:hypothetical protein